MSKYRKLPVVIDAFKWTGDSKQKEDPEWMLAAMATGVVTFSNKGTEKVHLLIETLEGVMTGRRGDYIIKGVNGEIYPCKPDIFEQTYELVK